MIPFARAGAVRTYRFALRVTARGLPRLDKVLRVHCALTAADHSVVGVTALAVHLGESPDGEHRLELVHETPPGVAPPKYYELTAFVAEAGAPTRRIASGGAGDGTEHRSAGILDAACARVALPDVVLRAERAPGERLGG